MTATDNDIRAIAFASELVTAHSDHPKRGAELDDLGIIKDGAVIYKGSTIIDVGESFEMIKKHNPASLFDASGRVVMPGFVDPHTHLVHMGSRHEEYECKIAGKSYADLHKVGGIKYTVSMTRAASEEELYDKALEDLDTMLLNGTTTVETKSGYGLTPESELKLLRIAKRLNEGHVIDVVSTFLGAHTVPEEFAGNKAGYVELVKGMMAKAAKYSEFADAWCDALGFSVDECRSILTTAKECGLKLKLHVEQTACSGGAELAVEMNVVSADHLDFASPEAIAMLATSGVIGVLLPGCMFHLMEFDKKIPVREMIDAGVAIALATDYNPGTSRTQSMQAILGLACRLYRMTYAQAINAATINAAYAIDRGNEIGSLAPGKKADMVLYECSHHGIIMNNFGVSLANMVMKNGELVVKEGKLLESRLLDFAPST
ncbi:MAG TPA: imidazolonepropionase [Oculatellaceae cyanobacterium]